MKTLVAIVLFALLPGGAAAAAEPSLDVKVAYADLNLASPEGQQALQARIEAAARGLCGVASPGLSMAFNAAITKCNDAATAAARRSIPAESVSAG